jgi:protocatechuate 3,4-dioxygenase beta subunit
MPVTRRGLIATLFAAPVLGVTAARAQAPALPPTPACGEDHDRTPRSSEGPFYTPDSPRRHDVAAGIEGGEPLLIGGFVLTPACAPVAGAVVDIWQADQHGRYDNDGYRLRGHVAADDAGRWWFATIVPARYPGRIRHIHVKVAGPQGAGQGRTLTTQLFFPDEPGNARDFLFDERLLLRMSGDGPRRFGRFDFVVG